MASGTIKGYKRTTLSATTGETQYQGYYYADVSLPIDIGRVISFFVSDATSNRPCFAIHIGGEIRAFSSVASTTVSITVLFI
jgi:hypothetical protein